MISGKDHDALLAAARSIFYPQRTYGRITAAAGEAVGDEKKERFLAWAGRHPGMRKRRGAVEALEYIAGLDPD